MTESSALVDVVLSSHRGVKSEVQLLALLCTTADPKIAVCKEISCLRQISRDLCGRRG